MSGLPELGNIRNFLFHTGAVADLASGNRVKSMWGQLVAALHSSILMLIGDHTDFNGQDHGGVIPPAAVKFELKRTPPTEAHSIQKIVV